MHMSIYDEWYDIRIANYEDISAIMNFIDELWKKDHILARDRAFFEYEHVLDGKVNFVIAQNRKTNELDGIVGFLPASRNKEHLDLWTVVWKTRPGCIPLLGMELMNRVQTFTSCRNPMGIGDNPKTTVRLLSKVDKEISIFKLEHFYLLSSNKQYHIACIRKKPDAACAYYGEKVIAARMPDACTAAEYIDFSDYSVCPYKDEWYIDHRFFSHPIYKYLVYGLRRGASRAIIVMRVQEYGGSKALRVVDYLGDQICFAGLHSFFIEQMEELDCEYTDFYVSGFDKKLIMQAGFACVEENDENIIPDYFNPFVNENIEIWADGKIKKCLFCKADGDQDRPC